MLVILRYIVLVSSNIQLYAYSYSHSGQNVNTGSQGVTPLIIIGVFIIVGMLHDTYKT